MVQGYDKKIEDCVNKVVTEKIKQMKHQGDKKSSDLAAQSAKLNNIKTQTGKNKTDSANHTTKINKMNQIFDTNKMDIAGHTAKLKELESQQTKLTQNVLECDSKIKDIENSLNFYSTDIDELKHEAKEIRDRTIDSARERPDDLAKQHTLTDVLIKKINHEHETNVRQEAYSRRNSILIEGVKERQYEDI